MYPRHALYRGNFGPAGFPARSPFLFGAPLFGGFLGGLLGGAIATGFTRPRYPYGFAGYGYGGAPYGGFGPGVGGYPPFY
ncbi:hypothetical protein [Bacillus amyloliquefaciens]|uniref:hypothetical protein n=1 Tax=Bacillus amyloliquefaciens TaxID=1390 RepID=UPI000E2505D6|nr:hypothetical protein [Bacillus amyloliquefaciens]RDY88897.1 hypothetical protein C3733_09310 [Bacillus amyloliquefaciens]